MTFKSVDHSEASGIVTLQMFITALAAWLALVSFFASSLARNFLQAVGFAIATFVGTVLLGSALMDGRMFFSDSIPAHSLLPMVVAAPAAIVTLLWLAYLNFKNFRDGWPLWRRWSPRWPAAWCGRLAGACSSRPATRNWQARRTLRRRTQLPTLPAPLKHNHWRRKAQRSHPSRFMPMEPPQIRRPFMN